MSKNHHRAVGIGPWSGKGCIFASLLQLRQRHAQRRVNSSSICIISPIMSCWYAGWWYHVGCATAALWPVTSGKGKERVTAHCPSIPERPKQSEEAHERWSSNSDTGQLLFGTMLGLVSLDSVTIQPMAMASCRDWGASKCVLTVSSLMNIPAASLLMCLFRPESIRCK